MPAKSEDILAVVSPTNTISLDAKIQSEMNRFSGDATALDGFTVRKSERLLVIAKDDYRYPENN